jgi:hypothetical protein
MNNIRSQSLSENWILPCRDDNSLLAVFSSSHAFSVYPIHGVNTLVRSLQYFLVPTLAFKIRLYGIEGVT